METYIASNKKGDNKKMRMYYIKDEEEYKMLMIKLLKKIDDCEYAYDIGLVDGCSFHYDENNQQIEKNCCNCYLEYCLLMNHINDDDVKKRILYPERVINYPTIMVITDSDFLSEKVVFLSLEDGKNNTKYGVY